MHAPKQFWIWLDTYISQQYTLQDNPPTGPEWQRRYIPDPDVSMIDLFVAELATVKMASANTEWVIQFSSLSD